MLKQKAILEAKSGISFVGEKIQFYVFTLKLVLACGVKRGGTSSMFRERLSQTCRAVFELEKQNYLVRKPVVQLKNSDSQTKKSS